MVCCQNVDLDWCSQCGLKKERQHSNASCDKIATYHMTTAPRVILSTSRQKKNWQILNHFAYIKALLRPFAVEIA